MADDFEAVWAWGRGIEAGEDLKEARHGAEAGDDHLLPGEDGGGGAQVGVDGEVGGGVAGGLVFHQGLLQQCVDAADSSNPFFFFQIYSACWMRLRCVQVSGGFRFLRSRKL